MSSEARVGTVLESILRPAPWAGAWSVRPANGPTKQISVAELRPITVPTAELAISLARCPLSGRCRAAGRAALGRCEPLGM